MPDFEWTRVRSDVAMGPKLSNLEDGIVSKHRRLKDAGLDLGGPTGTERTMSVAGVLLWRLQAFERGAIAYVRNGGFHEMHGAIYARWRQVEGSRDWPALPVTDENDDPARPGGRFNRFGLPQLGNAVGPMPVADIYWTEGTGAWEIRRYVTGWDTFLPSASKTPRGGVAGQRWFDGAAAVLGYPTSAFDWRETNPGPWPVYSGVQAFERGVIYQHHYPEGVDTGEMVAYVVTGAPWRKLIELGGPRAIGHAITDTSTSADGAGHYCHFEWANREWSTPASIFHSPGTGSHLVLGAIRQEWVRRGAEIGQLGYPVTDEEPWSGAVGGRRSDFEKGTITWSQAGGVSVSSSAPAPSPKPLPRPVPFFLRQAEELFVSDTESVMLYEGAWPQLPGAIPTGNVLSVRNPSESAWNLLVLKPGKSPKEAGSIVRVTPGSNLPPGSYAGSVREVVVRSFVELGTGTPLPSSLMLEVQLDA